jgi:hypothetical protein
LLRAQTTLCSCHSARLPSEGTTVRCCTHPWNLPPQLLKRHAPSIDA